MATISELKDQYDNLDHRVQIRDYSAIDPGCLLAFENEFPEQETLVQLDTDEFTAVCPWTGQPDYGALDISYVPSMSCIELKSSSITSCLTVQWESFRNPRRTGFSTTWWPCAIPSA